jgi:hypothetical protein
VVSAEELERTRALTASVSAQRDRLAADRDRLARSRDDVAADRDRLRRDHDALARRLERLEREAAERRRAEQRYPTQVLSARPAAVPERHDPTRALAPAEAAGAAVGDPAHRNWREPGWGAGAELDRAGWPAADRDLADRDLAGGAARYRDDRGRPARYAGGGDAGRYRDAGRYSDAGRQATARYREPGRGTVAVSDGEPARPAPSTPDGRGLFRRSRPAAPAPAPAPVAVARSRRGPVARLGRMLRRLIGLAVLLVAFAVLAVVGVAALTDRTPVQVIDTVTTLYEQVRSVGGG